MREYNFYSSIFSHNNSIIKKRINSCRIIPLTNIHLKIYFQSMYATAGFSGTTKFPYP